jgi:hypothetical protein
VFGLVWWEQGIKDIAIGLAVIVAFASMWEARRRWKERIDQLQREREDGTRR